MTTLAKICSDYATIRPLSPGARYLLGRTVALFSAFLGRVARSGDLDDMTVSRWLESLEKQQAAITRAGHRTRILCLWRFAARRKLCQPPGEVRRCPVPAPIPEAWTVSQVGSLVAACDQLPVDVGRWFRATILTCYESGLRRGDVRRLRRGQIGEGGIVVRQRKTGQPHLVAIRPETAALVLSLPGEFPLACPWGTRTYGAWWSRLRAAAGLTSGACQQLRRTGATWVAADQGMDAASRWLGHRSPEMVRWYVDQRISERRPALPPKVA